MNAGCPDGAAPVGVDVLHPLRGFLHRAAAQVEADLGMGSGQAAEIDKCIGAEMVILSDGLRIQTVHVVGGGCRRQDSKLSWLDSGIAGGN
jgi:hypothetical protein